MTARLKRRVQRKAVDSARAQQARAAQQERTRRRTAAREARRVPGLLIADHAAQRRQERVEPDLSRAEAGARLVGFLEGGRLGTDATGRRFVEHHDHPGVQVRLTGRGSWEVAATVVYPEVPDPM